MVEKWYLTVVLIYIALTMSENEHPLFFHVSICISVGCFYSYPMPIFLLGFHLFLTNF